MCHCEEGPEDEEDGQDEEYPKDKVGRLRSGGVLFSFNFLKLLLTVASSFLLLFTSRRQGDGNVEEEVHGKEGHEDK